VTPLLVRLGPMAQAWRLDRPEVKEMDAHLIHQLNRAVDRGDELVKRDLMIKAAEIKQFIEVLSRADPRIIELLRLAPPAFKEAAFIAYLVQVLGFYLDKMKGKNKPSRGVLAWYQKAHAWHTAVNLEIWD
jgi:hypothetical protein